MRFVKADPKIESVYNHRVYQFSSMAAKLEFDHAPESYCVQFDGADPVEMLQTGIAVEGQYLREHNGRFYLFLSKKSWEAFKAGAGTAPKSVAATTSLESPAVASTPVIQLAPSASVKTAEESAADSSAKIVAPPAPSAPLSPLPAAAPAKTPVLELTPVGTGAPTPTASAETGNAAVSVSVQEPAGQTSLLVKLMHLPASIAARNAASSQAGTTAQPTATVAVPPMPSEAMPASH